MLCICATTTDGSPFCASQHSHTERDPMCIKRDEFFEDLGTDIDKAMSQRDFSITYSGRQAEVVGITDAIATGVFVFVIVFMVLCNSSAGSACASVKFKDDDSEETCQWDKCAGPGGLNHDLVDLLALEDFTGHLKDCHLKYSILLV